MKKTLTRVFGLMLAVALPMAGLTIASNTNSEAPASLQLDVAVASGSSATPTIAPATARPVVNRGGNGATPYPSMIYNPLNNTYSTPIVGDNSTAISTTVQRYSGLGSWWSSFYESLVVSNTSMINIENKDDSNIYVGPWSRDVIASDYIITLR